MKTLPLPALFLWISLLVPTASFAGIIDTLLQKSQLIEGPYGVDEKIDRILDLDVIGFFFDLKQTSDSTYKASRPIFGEATREADSLAKLFNTKLKVKRYKESQEFKENLSSLKKKRDSLSSVGYYTALQFKDFPDYEPESGSFKIIRGKNIYSREALAYFPKTINGIHFALLPTTLKPFQLLDFKKPGVNEEFISIKVSETIAANIEENQKNIELLLFFKLSGKKKFSSRLYEMRQDQWYVATKSMAYANSFRMVLRNSVDKTVYYDRIFTPK